MRFLSITKIAAAAALALAAGSATASENTSKARCLLQPGLTEWYDMDPGIPNANLIGYQDVTCECVRQGPYGAISEFEVFTPYTC